ncbi:restriction endonuclease subunit R [Leptolyngbya sp. 7M]|uniref:restriction endonuclease subunit R n=1 Tax=Leptolyngbya sp. 7M TaxID=2812896 RepID=UPI001B8B8CB5|nr:restriction endonuclease subunit R [Leptolyngbya sp. 7M]QYO62164.1 restriction endonuclease subunit R [Leptolyngbya sp. 7M]
MVQLLQAQAVTLRDLIDNFGLVEVRSQSFFPEWQQNLPELSEFEIQYLDKVKAGYLNLRDALPVLERPVQMVIVAPLLFLADFYLPPFQVKTERSIEISEEDEGIVIRGTLDIVILKDNFWLLIIESKRLSFSLEVGIAQLLSYMIASSQPERPSYGLLTNGSNFMFVKLIRSETWQYATSDQFATRNQTNGLYDAFRILKRIGQL